MRYPVLALLASGHVHGYDIKQAFDDQFGAVWPPVNIGQVYVTLSRLERDGLVESTQISQSNRPNKRAYELKPRGHEALEEWLSETSLDKKVRDDFYMKLVLARAAGLVEPSRLIAKQREAYLQAITNLDQLGRREDVAGQGPAWLLVEGTILHLHADLTWLDLCERHFINGGTRA